MERVAVTVLLDTHALIWLMEEDRRLGRESRRLADAALRDDQLTVSAVTFWETAMLQRLGRIELVLPAENWRRAVCDLGIGEIPVSGDIGLTAAALEDFPLDPADRFIAATAIREHATLVTADRHVLGWAGGLIRRDART